MSLVSLPSNNIRTIIGYITILAIGMSAIFLLNLKADKEYEAAKKEYISSSSMEAHAVAEKVEDAIKAIYQNLRTISLLPSIRNAARHGENLSADGLLSIQQIYNNLTDNVSISELHIVPSDFNPTIIDPHTGKNEEPIRIFDDLMGKSSHNLQEEKEEEAESDHAHHTHEAGDKTYEYGLMIKQLDWFKKNYPDDSKIEGINVPIISGPSVIIGDNTEYSKTNNDKDRMGLVFTVPFFEPTGKLKGSVTVSIRDNKLKELLPEANFSIVNSAYAYINQAGIPGQSESSMNWVKQGVIDPNLIYSEVIAIEANDPQGTWLVWAGLPDSTFYASDSYLSIRNFKYFSIGFTAFIMFLALYAQSVANEVSKKNDQLVLKEQELKEANSSLEQRVEERTAELQKISDDLEEKNISLKEAVAQADYANESKSNFLANMSHELRTPLNAIIGLSELLVEELKEEENKTYLEPMSRILNAGKHLLALINDILDISKIEAGKMELFIEEFKVKDALDEILVISEPLASKNNNKLKFECSDDIGTLRNDTTKFKQIIINLISNACKFTKDGQVTLRVSKKTTNGDEIEFAVIDTGIGITQDQISKLFSNFVQADSSTTKKFGGTGLGLAITKRMSELMGGSINITSEIGKGTTMTITLPRMAEARMNKDSAHLAVKQKITQVQSISDLKILVIEDNETERELIDKYLKNAGYTATFAVNGEEGLKMAVASHPDLIMLDIFLPGINGWDVLHTLKSNSKTWDINVVMISMLEEKNKGYVMGASDYLVKPFNQGQLSQVLSRYIIDNGLNGNDLGRVLIVEDDADARLILKTALKKFHVEIEEATNGAEGLEKLAKNKPNLIMLDLMMPVMDGFEFIENLKKSKEWADIPIIVNTAKELNEVEKPKLEGSVAKILHKSKYSTEDMLAEVKTILETIKRNK
jgi:signal transduction histidine kinase/DNA-binding response OmpR family regulator